MACKALTARWEQMVKLVVALTERFAPVLEVLVAAVEEEAAAATEAEGMVEAATEAEAIQLLRTHVSLIHHLVVFLLPDHITAAKPTPTPTPPPPPPPSPTPSTTQPTSLPSIRPSPTPSIQPTPAPSPGFNNVVITQSSTEITWSSGWTVLTSPCNATIQSRFTVTENQWFTFLTSPNSSK